jgi:hypothetical protein
MPVQWEIVPKWLRERYLDRYYEYRNMSVGPSAMQNSKMNIEQVLKFILGVNARTCKQYTPQELTLNGDIAYGMEEQFINEARMAVRLANFLSGFLQVSKKLFLIAYFKS